MYVISISDHVGKTKFRSSIRLLRIERRNVTYKNFIVSEDTRTRHFTEGKRNLSNRCYSTSQKHNSYPKHVKTIDSF